LSEESVVVVCPNPKCQREIDEPILLTIRSVTPPAQYKACPYCFTKLEPEPPAEQEDVLESTVEPDEVMDMENEYSQSDNSVLEKVKDSGPRFLQKVKALIPNSDRSQNEVDEPEEPQAEPVIVEEELTVEEEPETEPVAKEEPKVEPRTKSPDKKGSESSGCPERFGYLANRPPDTPIPPQCLVCPKMVDCMLSPRES
jgi:hypothetical protein